MNYLSALLAFKKLKNTFKHNTAWEKSKVVIVSTLQDKYFKLYTMYKQYSSTPSRHHVSEAIKTANFKSITYVCFLGL